MYLEQQHGNDRVSNTASQWVGMMISVTPSKDFSSSSFSDGSSSSSLASSPAVYTTICPSSKGCLHTIPSIDIDRSTILELGLRDHLQKTQQAQHHIVSCSLASDQMDNPNYQTLRAS